VRRLQSELKGKQEELQAVESRLADASESLGAKMQKATDARKAINDLRTQITNHSGKKEVRS
jgi:predicted  nucleic acid-binding Zn-ribbon protein